MLLPSQRGIEAGFGGPERGERFLMFGVGLRQRGFLLQEVGQKRGFLAV